MVACEVLELRVAQTVNPTPAKVLAFRPEPVERAERRVTVIDRTAAGKLEDVALQPAPAIVLGKSVEPRIHRPKGRRPASPRPR